MSMNAAFKDELRGLLHPNPALLRVFVVGYGGQHPCHDLGGVDHVRAGPRIEEKLRELNNEI